MKNNSLLSVLIIGVVLVAAYFIVQTVRQSAQVATAPFQQVNQANQALQTQVSNLLHPTPTIIPDPVTYINEVRALARLETIQYSVEKVITGETGGGAFKAVFGDKFLSLPSIMKNPMSTSEIQVYLPNQISILKRLCVRMLRMRFVKQRSKTES